MLFLLLLPSCVCLVVTYIVTRTNAIARLVATVLRVLLRRLEAQGSDSSVGPCPGGVLLTGIQVPGRLLAFNDWPVTVSSGSVRSLQLLWATPSRPLTLRVSGVTVRVQQRRTAPKAVPGVAQLSSSSSKLQELEALLWHGQQQSSSAGWRARKQRLLRFLVALALRNISVTVEDVSLTYVQTGAPVPVLKNAETGAVDAVAVALRSLVLSPVTSNEDSGASSGSSALRVTRQRQPSAEPEEADNGEPTGRQQQIEGRLQRWWRRFARLQALCYRFPAASGSPIRFCNASRISVTGVSLTLLSRSSATGGPCFQGRPLRWPQHVPPGHSDIRKRIRLVGGVKLAPGLVAGTADTEPAAAAAIGLPEPEWDFMYTVMQQWSMEVEVSLDSDSTVKQEGNRSTRSGRQPPAVKVHGAFGIRSSRSQQASALPPARGDSRGRSHGPSPECVSPNGPSPRQSLRSFNLLQLQRDRPPPQQPAQGHAATPAASGSGAAAGATAHGGGGSAPSSSIVAPFTVQISISLKAFLPELTPDATVQVLRMAERLSTYQKYSKYWRVRPSATVRQSPAAWWQHAGQAIINDCRQHYPLRKMRDFMSRRAEYVRCYKELHSTQGGFLPSRQLPRYSLNLVDYRERQPEAAGPGDASTAGEPAAAADAAVRTPFASGRTPLGRLFTQEGSAAVPGRSSAASWPLESQPFRSASRGSKSLGDLRTRLACLESQLTLGQIMCYRIFVALWHSRYLERNPHARERWEDMGVITTFVDAVPSMVDGEEDEDEDGDDAVLLGHERSEATGSSPKRAAPSVVRLRISCPRLGLKLVNKHAPSSGPAAHAGLPTTQPPGEAKRSADVLAVVLEGIQFAMPTAHHSTLEAATIRVSLLGNATAPAKHLVTVPALLESMEQHGSKLDFSSTSARSGKSYPSSTKPSSAATCIYPDAPISSYLSRYKVELAPVELSLTHPPLVLACAEYLKRMAQLQSLAKPARVAGPDAECWPSTSVHSLVMDSCMRNRVPLPSSMAAFTPKLQLHCPMVTARGLLLPERTPSSIGGISGPHSEVLAVAVFTDIIVSSRYVNSCYAALLHRTSAYAHGELYFQMLPRGQTNSAAAEPSDPLVRPQQGPFPKVWLHPDDVGIAYPPQQEALAGVSSLERPLAGRDRLARSISALGATNTSRLSGLSQGGSVQRSVQHSISSSGARALPPSTNPFLPVLKLRGISALATSQVPYEPAVPGTMTSHQTVGVHSVLAWFSPWQAQLLMAAIEQVRAHPVLAILRSDQNSTKPCAGTAPSPEADGAATATTNAAASARAGDPQPRAAEHQQHGAPEATAAKAATGGFRVSLLVDIPLLSINCYVEAPRDSNRPDDLLGRREATGQPGAELQLPAWVMTSGEWQTSAVTDPVLRWGLRLTPLLTANVTGIRAGLRLTGSRKFHASVHTLGFQVSDHQARFKSQIYKEIWLPNAGRATRRAAATGAADLLPESSSHQLVGPLGRRSDALRAFARDRRRAALRLRVQCAPTQVEKQGQCRQLWRRLLEARQLQRASDFAMFLLSSTHRTAARLSTNAALQPVEHYNEFLQGYRAAGQELDGAASGTAVPTAEQSQPSARNSNGLASSLPGFMSSPSVGGIGASVSGGVRAIRRHVSSQARSLGALGDFAALDPGGSPGRQHAGAAPHRKTMSMFQVLNSFSAAAAALHRQSLLAAAVARNNGSDVGGSYNGTHRLGQIWSSVSRASMGRIPEDGGPPSSSLHPVISERDAISGQPSVASFASASTSAAGAAGASFRARASMFRRNSSNLGRTSRADGEVLPGLLPGRRDGLGEAHLSGMHSVFTTASAESRAAAAGAAAGQGSSFSGVASAGISGAQPPLPFVSVTEAEAKLSFVQAYLHLGQVSLPQQGRVFVHCLPCPTPSAKVVVTQSPADSGAPAATHIRTSGSALVACVGVHSLGAMLHMLVQVQQAILKSVPASPPATPVAATQASAVPPSVFKAQVDVGYVSLEVIVEEKPRRADEGKSVPAVPGLTELTSVVLQDVGAYIGPEDGTPADEPNTQVATVRVKNVHVLDLQGCVEHRNVLVPNDRVRASLSSMGIPSQPDSARASVLGSGGMEAVVPPKACRLDVTCRLPPRPDVPMQLSVRVDDPCVTLLRRYVNNLSYAAGVVHQAYADAASRYARRSSAGNPIATASDPRRPHADGLPHAAAAPPVSPSTEILVQVNNMSAILPAGVIARKQPIRRSLQNDALVVNVESVTLSIPGGSLLQRLRQLAEWTQELSAGLPPAGNPDEPAIDLTWMAHGASIDALIRSSLRLGEQHFPQLSQQAPRQDASAVTRGSASAGERAAARVAHQKPVAVSEKAVVSHGGLLQKHLQAAKENILNPIKEVLREAGHKRNKRHGEQGLLVIEEVPSRTAAADTRPGYLTVPEERTLHDDRSVASAAAAHHTTTVLYADVAPSGITGRTGNELMALEEAIPLQGQEHGGISATSSSLSAGANLSFEQRSGSDPLSGASRTHPPTLLFSVVGLSAYSCRLVPYDSTEHSRHRRVAAQQQAEAKQTAGQGQAKAFWSRLSRAHLPAFSSYPVPSPSRPSTPAGPAPGPRARRPPQDLPDGIVTRYRASDASDLEVDLALDLLAHTELQQLQCLINPSNLQGVIFTHETHGSLRLHLKAPDGMEATLGPTSYDRMLKVLTDNVVEARSSFNAGAASSAGTAHWNTSFNPQANFGPRPGQRPYFQLTVDWPEYLQAVLETDPSWWTPGQTLGANPAEPCLQACFTKCNLGLVMVQGANDMHIAFNSQYLHIADVRIDSRLREAAEPGTSVSAHGSDPDLGASVPLRPLVDKRSSGTGASGGGEGDYYETEEGETQGSEADGAEHVDEYGSDESTEAPEGLNVQPVIDVEPAKFPSRQAVITLIRSGINLPADEATHLAKDPNSFEDAGECPRDTAHSCVRVSFGMLHDGTMCNEIELCHTLVQWPYLTEMSLVSSVISIFLPTWGRSAASPDAALRLAPTPWLYFNLVLRDSQLYVPILTPHLRQYEYGWRAAASDTSGNDLQLTADKLQQLFSRMVAPDACASPSYGTEGTALQQLQPGLPQPALRSSFIEEQRWTSQGGRAPSASLGDWVGGLSPRNAPERTAAEEEQIRLEEMGVVLTMSALRVGYFAGDDGESLLKVDLRNAAGFVRYRGAQVANWLLPIKSIAMEYHCSMPLVNESKVLQKFISVARMLVFQLRTRKKARRNWRTVSSLQESAQSPEKEPPAAQGTLQRASDGAHQGTAAFGLGADEVASIRSRRAKPDEGKSSLDLLVELATARASGLLEQHKLSLPTSAATQVTLENLLGRKAMITTLTVKLDTAVFRASFSNVPLWHALMDDLGLATSLMQRNNGLFAPAPALQQVAAQPVAIASRTTPSWSQSEAYIREKASWSFRPGKMSVNLDVKSLAVVLCDDKPKSYGAPDVLTTATERFVLEYNTDKRFFDHMPEQSGSLSLVLSAQFLNNSTGRWEHLLEPWPAELHLSDPVNPIFKSSRTKYVYVTSKELLKLSFHPSCLLTIGDLLAFTRQLCNSDPAAAIETPGSEKPPTSQEQMALGGSIMSRVPQRYLIQNMTGMLLSYWAPASEHDGRSQDGRVNGASNKKMLRSGCSEELRVAPTAKEVKIVGPGGTVNTRLTAQVIVLKFEGNWLPIPDVSVDVVGKYCYTLYSPADDRRTPVIVDVVLVGRTKILKIHSALYIQNNTTMKVSFRLHLPSALLARQIVLANGDMQLPGEQDIKLRPLAPGKGRYLPVVAALGGVLYLEPFKYLPAEHDVIRLFPAVTDMPAQSGFIACGRPPDGTKGLYGKAPLHFAVKIKVKSRTEYSYTTFHSMEVPGPGEFAKASRPLEASIKLTPTTVISNSLPYRMEGYLVTLSGSDKGPDVDQAAGVFSAPAAHNHVGHHGGAAELKGGMRASVETALRLGRPRHVDGAAVDDNEACNKVISELRELALLLKPDLCFPDVRAKSADDAKCLLLALLRYELRWAAKRAAKEMEILVRTDNESSDKISWQELGAFVEWAKRNVRRVAIPPGGIQHQYVDMRKQAVLCIKVPELKLVCSRPVELNHGARASSSREAEELPEFMRLTRVEEPETLDKVIQEMKERKERATVLQGVKEKMDNAIAALRASPDPRAAGFGTGDARENVRSNEGTYWQDHPDKLLRVELQVVPGPWPGPGADRDATHHRHEVRHSLAASMLSPALPHNNGHGFRPRSRALSAAAAGHFITTGAQPARARIGAAPAVSPSTVSVFMLSRAEADVGARSMASLPGPGPSGSAASAPFLTGSALVQLPEDALPQASGTGVNMGGTIQPVAEEHVRIQLRYRPGLSTAQAPLMFRVQKHLQNIMSIFPGAKRDGADDVSLGSAMQRVDSASALRHSAGQGATAPYEQRVRAEVSVVRGTDGSAERVRLRISVVSLPPASSRSSLPTSAGVGCSLAEGRPPSRQPHVRRWRQPAGRRSSLQTESHFSASEACSPGGATATARDGGGHSSAAGLSRARSQPVEFARCPDPHQQADNSTPSGPRRQLERLVTVPVASHRGSARTAVLSGAAHPEQCPQVSSAFSGAVQPNSSSQREGTTAPAVGVSSAADEGASRRWLDTSIAAAGRGGPSTGDAASPAPVPVLHRATSAASPPSSSSPHTPEPVATPERSSAVSPGVVNTARSSVRTPGTMVEVHSGANSPISVPSPGMDAPATYTVWSENHAYTRGSGVSSESVPDLPTRRRPSEFGRTASEAYGPLCVRLDGTPEEPHTRSFTSHGSHGTAANSPGDAASSTVASATGMQPAISLVAARSEPPGGEAPVSWPAAVDAVGQGADDARQTRYAGARPSPEASDRSGHGSGTSGEEEGVEDPVDAPAQVMAAVVSERLSLLSPQSQPLRMMASGRSSVRHLAPSLRRRSGVSQGGVAVRRPLQRVSPSGIARGGSASAQTTEPELQLSRQGATSLDPDPLGILRGRDGSEGGDSALAGGSSLVQVLMRRSGTTTAKQRAGAGLPAIREAATPVVKPANRQSSPAAKTSPESASSSYTSARSSPPLHLRPSHGDVRASSEGSGIRSEVVASQRGRLDRVASERVPASHVRSRTQRRTSGRKSLAHSPLQIAKTAIGSAKSVVPRLPSIARNMGEKIVDGSQHVAGAVLHGGTEVVSKVGDALVQGGHQVVQGVPQVASMVADTLLAGGQEVKEKVVASTEAVIDAAKPKIKFTFRTLAWQVTEGLRRRKQGDRPQREEFKEETLSPRGSKKKKEANKTPKVVFLNLHNSLATKEEDHVCRLSVYAPFWVDNRTGFDLVFKDLDAPAVMDSLPFLLWQPVCAPGYASDAKCLDNPSDAAPESAGGVGGVGNGHGARMPRAGSTAGPGISPTRRATHAHVESKLALLNDQPRTRFRVDDDRFSKTDFGGAFTVATTSQKYAVEIKAEEFTMPASELGHGTNRPSCDSSQHGLRSTRPSDATGVGATLGPECLASQSVPLLQLPPLPGQEAQHIAWEVPQGGPAGADAIMRDGQRTSDGTGTLKTQSHAHGSEAQSGGTSPAAHVAGAVDVARPFPASITEITPIEEEPVDEPAIAIGNVPLPPLPGLPNTPEHRSPQDGAAEQVLSPVSSTAATMVLRLSTAGVGRFSEAGAQSVAGVSGIVAGNRLSAKDQPGHKDSTFPSTANGAVRNNGSIVAAACSRLVQRFRQEPEMVSVRRLYQFAVEVWPAPNNTVFKRTKLITVKNKYLIRNATGLTIEYKQKGTPDPDILEYGLGQRFSRRLENGWRAAWHWDNAYAEQELMIRPAGDDWEWSGSFKLPETEDYFGLRIRHRSRREYVIIPVNITVGAAGSVLVTLKSKESVPPYMVINRCRDVVIRLKQADWPSPKGADGWEDWDEIQPSAHSPIPFAWDEPRLRHTVKVVATSQQNPNPMQANAMEVNLDAVDVFRIIYVQSRSLIHQGAHLGSRSDAREKLQYLSDNAKKVYVTVYADGPTRVLCFSEDRTGAANMDDENSLLNLSYRLNQVAVRLKDVEHKLVLQLGCTQGRSRGALESQGSLRDAGAAASLPEASNLEADQRPTLHVNPQVRAVAAASGSTPPSLSDATGPTSRPPSLSGWAHARAVFHPSRAPAQPVTGGPGGSVSGPGRMASLRPQGLAPAAPGPVGLGAFRRLPSLGHRQGSGYAPGPSRNPSLPHSGSAMQQGHRPHHSRNMSGHSCVAGQTSPGHVGLPQLLAASAGGPADGNVGQLLEALTVYGNDIDAPVGGDLTVVMRSVEGLTAGFSSYERLVAVEAKMRIQSSDPSLQGKQDQLKATAVWNQPTETNASASAGTPSGGDWASNVGRVDLRSHVETFRDIPASAELLIDFYVTKATEQAHVWGGSHGWKATPGPLGYGQVTSSPKPTAVRNPTIAVSAGQFAGCVRVPLLLTFGREQQQEWRFSLERRHGSQTVRGHVVLSFEWSVTGEGLLMREVTALENILAQKLELLASMNPLPATVTAAFVRMPGSGAPAPTRAAAAMAASMGTVTEAASAGEGSRRLGVAAAGPEAVLSPSALPDSKTAKALSESYTVDLEVSVLEVSGLLPREGLRANIVAALQARQQSANLLSTAMLPKAVVTISCAGETHTASAGLNSVHPRFPKNTSTFKTVPLGAKVQLQVYDQLTSSFRRLLAEAELNVSDIPGTDPQYAWLALPRCLRRPRSQRMLALVTALEEEGSDVDVQMLVRIKIHKPQIHGVLATVALDLAGVGLCAKTNLEELFNFTVQKIRASLVQTRTELQLSSVVHALQLDNQLLEASNPVVLSKADESQSGSMAHARRRHKTRLALRGSSSFLRVGSQEPALQDPLLSFQMVYNQASSNQAGASAEGQTDSVGIMSFKKVVLELGPLDFSADQEFIEALVAYLNVLPTADLNQDAAWRAQIDAKQSPGTAIDEDAAAGNVGHRDKNAESTLMWLLLKEAAELELLRGQSSMWFYLGDFYLSDIFINVTLSLSSSFNAGAHSAATTAQEGQRSMLRGFMSRVSGSNGFQLINVTNAPIQLEYVAFQNRLVNRVSLVNTLWRHYSWIALAQARKVLGGAGPAIAAIPASVLWASLALVDLGQDVAAKRVSPVQVPMRIGYVMLTLSGQVIGVFSRAMCTMMGILPPRFSVDTANLSDSEAARRFTVKPQTFMDALYLAQRDVLLGVMAAAYGFMHDTAAGARWPGSLPLLGVPTGVAKASLGLVLRPVAGTVEATSKILQGAGLLCLGKRGIQGKMVRRMQAPGVAITDVVQAARASAVQEAYQAALIAAWQGALPAISAALADDEVVDVVAARATRVVLLTNRHLAYIYARRHPASSSSSHSAASASGACVGEGMSAVTYRVKWIIPKEHIDNIRGLERGYAINVEYHKPVKLGRMSLKLPLRKGMRTSTAESHKNLIFRLNRHIGHLGGNPTRDAGSLAAAANGGTAAAAEVDVQDLRIMG